jgi:hypothetical protein
MKKIFNIILISSCILAFASCEMFKMDNYDGPNAKIKGIIKDSSTGQAVPTDIQNGTAIRAYELGWTEPAVSNQTFVVKQHGEYQNDMIFAGTYNLEIINGNVYPVTYENVVLKKGSNTYDVVATPYIRIKNQSITKNGNIITATFSLEAGKPEVKVSAIRLYAHSDIYVGEQVKFGIEGTARRTFSPSIAIDGTTYTLTIDVSAYPNNFKYSTPRNYYFRIGALADVANQGTIRYNYGDLEIIKMSF